MQTIRVVGVLGALALTLSAQVDAATITTGSLGSALVGTSSCQSGFADPQCRYQGFDTAGNLAFTGGAAAPAIASSTIGGHSTIHNEQFINDGQYGNGRSWIGSTANSWLKIDLGFAQSIGAISFGRDRLGHYDDRDPGQFIIEFALLDTVFASGNAADDATEYGSAINSSSLGFGGLINGSDTVFVNFNDAPVNARFIKMTFASSGAAIDEVEVFAAIPEPASLALVGLALAGLALSKRRRA